MNTQHTPGPWQYARLNGSPTTGQHMIKGAIPGYLAEVRDCGSGDVVANARLIAAAPELLAALEGMEKWASSIHDGYPPSTASIAAAPYREAARAAIAKATGEVK